MDPIREPDDERDDGLDVSDLSLDGTGDGTSDGSLPVTGDAKIIKLVRKYKGKFKVDFDGILWRPVVNRPRFLWLTILTNFYSIRTQLAGQSTARVNWKHCFDFCRLEGRS